MLHNIPAPSLYTHKVFFEMFEIEEAMILFWWVGYPITRYLFMVIVLLPLSVTCRDKIHEGVSRVFKEFFGVLAGCLKYDFRLLRVQNTKRFLVLFRGCW